MQSGKKSILDEVDKLTKKYR